MQLTSVVTRNSILAISTTILLAALLSSCSREPENPADAVYFGGDILTMAGDQPQYVEALAVDDGKFSFVGTKAEADKLVGKETKQVDLLGATLIPSVVAGVQQDLTLQGATSTPNCWKEDATFNTSAEVIAALKSTLAEREQMVSGLFCLGYSPNASNAAGALTEADLDAAFPDTSVILVESSLQRVLTNSVAKKKFSLDAFKVLKNAIRQAGTQNAGMQTGQSADFMIIDKNPLKDASVSLATIQITQSIVQGKPVLDGPKDLAMLAVLDIFAAYTEENAAKAKLNEMNAATEAVKASESALATKKSAEKKAVEKKVVEKKMAQKTTAVKKPIAVVNKPVAELNDKEDWRRDNAKKPLENKPAPIEATAGTEPAKPKEARFNMTQNGKKMTPEDFDAWMKAQGIRIVPAKPVETVKPVEN